MQGLLCACQELDMFAHSLNGGFSGLSSTRFHDVAEQNDKYSIHSVHGYPQQSECAYFLQKSMFSNVALRLLDGTDPEWEYVITSST